jgi:aryl-alcohol dehydrogenase-like predicted oxidoreductase
VQLRTGHWTPTEVVAQLEGSLRALQTDYVGLYQMHSGALEVFDRHDLWEAVNQQVANGKVRHLGVSLGGGDVDQAQRATEVGASAIQVGYNRLDQTAEQGVLPACLGQELGVMVREPLANGYLSGKYGPDAWVTQTTPPAATAQSVTHYSSACRRLRAAIASSIPPGEFADQDTQPSEPVLAPRGRGECQP